jgi:MarR family 2-MHQ and catechol resistance regulon transcriptional repressor
MKDKSVIPPENSPAAAALTAAVLVGDATKGAHIPTPPWVQAAIGDLIKGEGLSCAHVAVRLLRVYNRLTRGMEVVFRRHGLSLPRFEILLQLWFSPTRRMTLCDLSANLLVPPSNLTGLIDRLERDHLVVRVPDTEDRRLVFAQITPQGEELLAQVVPEYLTDLTRLLGALSSHERVQLAALLERADQALSEKGTGICLSTPPGENTIA